MYQIAPPAVLAHEIVIANPANRERVERVVAALNEPVPITIYNDDTLGQHVLGLNLVNRRSVMGTQAEIEDPVLLFDTFRFDSDEDVEARKKSLVAQGVPESFCRSSLVGTGAFHWARYNLDGDPNQHDKVCRPCWRIHLAEGCLHRCAYCNYGGLLVTMVNVEEYCDHLGEIIRRHPWQKTYLLDDDADPPGLEPELGCLGPLIEYFGTLDDRYLIIHTKTWNTHWMRDLRHNGNTIIVWSISGPTQSRQIEPVTGTTERRIEAARVAQEAGYQIRYKFKPIIPVKNWREDAEHAVRLLFERTNPDVISLCTYMWRPVQDLKAHLPVDLLEPAYVRAAEESEEEVANTTTKPFPEWVRAEIYEHYLREIRKYDPDIPVSLSTESFDMWKRFEDLLGATATNYVCGCGPQSTPGAKKLSCHAFDVAVCDREGIPGVVV
ncbi:MAG: hypothetical protein GY851_23010 [bacterium]|nr:hypothetical protein [bacterium]